MPKLKTVLQSLDELDEGLHGLYVETDGKWILDVEGVDDHPSVRALKNALDHQKADRRKVNDELTKLRERVARIPEDFDPDKYAELVAKLEEYETDPAKKGQGEKERNEAVAARKMLEQKISSIEKAHAEAVRKKEEELRRKDGFIGQLLIDDGLTKALIEAGVGREYMEAEKALIKADCKVIEEDGAYKAIVDSDTGPLDIGKYVQDWVASDDGKPFIPPAKGSDAGNSGKPNRVVVGEQNPWSKEHWNLTIQGKILREDRAKAERFAKAAGKMIPTTV